MSLSEDKTSVKLIIIIIKNAPMKNTPMKNNMPIKNRLMKKQANDKTRKCQKYANEFDKHANVKKHANDKHTIVKKNSQYNAKENTSMKKPCQWKKQRRKTSLMKKTHIGKWKSH